jgi:outer membrane protein assembly factor BamB
MSKTGMCALWGAALMMSASAGDWPQFCGVQRNNVSAETGLARSWPADGPEEIWSVDVTTGYAGPAIKDGKVYLLEHTDGVSSIRCFAFDSGKELWTCSFDDPGELKNKKYPGTRGTPTVTDDSLYAVTLFGTAVCIDLKSHTLKWQHSLKQDYGKDVGGFGVAQSPLLHGDLVILAPMSAEGSVVAVNRNSGAVVWTTSGYPGTGFVSPSLISVDGKDQLLVVAGGEKPPKKRRKKKTEEPAAPKKVDMPQSDSAPDHGG